MGGFHFPPGVDPQKLRGQTGIGLKRPFDAVSSSTTKPVQIHYGQAQPVKREVLGSLDLGDPNLKRARR
ncbi:hypothetical protein H0H93_000300 [Arthromyces matolae]|nr:hypothetical protein H0H93_000300 [Arthromyces matolae]